MEHALITWDTFDDCVKQVKALSDDLQDGWCIHKMNSENGTYITKKVSHYYDTPSEDAKEEGIQKVLINYEYHVAYNTSYSVPVLCFNSWKTDGSLDNMEECWDRFRFGNVENNFMVLTQMDHPVLMKPFLTLHPCRTTELMKTFKNSKNPVVSWLSTVGPSVHLNLLQEYGNLTF